MRKRVLTKLFQTLILFLGQWSYNWRQACMMAFMFSLSRHSSQTGRNAKYRINVKRGQ